jgi:hypothetical protein
MLIHFIAVSLFLQPAYAGKKGHAHGHGAHAHGRGNIDIAIEADGKTGAIEFKSPAESIYGFEHAAKSEKDKKAAADGLALLEAKIGTIVQFAPEAGCELSKKEIETHQDGKHAEVEGAFGFSCKQSLLGTKVTFGVGEVFPKLKKVQVQVVGEKLQKALEVKDGKGSLDL